MHDYTVVVLNPPGFRNIITDEPFTGEKKSHLILGFIIDNILEYIRKQNNGAPIIASAFSAGGCGLLDHFLTNSRDVAGVVFVSPVYYTSRNISYLHMPTTIDLFLLYAKNFLKTKNIKKLFKLINVGLDARMLYRINNNEKTKIQGKNLTNTPVIGLHCIDDTVNSFDDAKLFFKRMNSPFTKLIEFSDQGHSLTYTMVGTCIEQSDELCNNWIENRNKGKE